MNKVEIIADSTNEFGQRITTAILTFPRYLLAEVNTHRMLSRNSASSRAIRFEKMVKSVNETPFIPFKWQKDHSGMQGTEYWTESDILRPIPDQSHEIDAITHFTNEWLAARDAAVYSASHLNKMGLTKQLCNRLLEPFMYHTALVTGTELENFFALRAQDAAEIHFQDLAYKMLDAMNQSEPKKLKAGEWHIPFGDAMPDIEDDITRVKLATTRCARISYITPDSQTSVDYEADLKLHDRLAQSGHWSAFEHCAQAMSEEQYYGHLSGSGFRSEIDAITDWKALEAKYGEDAYSGKHSGEFDTPGRLIYEHMLPFEDSRFGWCGNFRGFIQYRKMFTDENRNDSRLIKK